MHVIFIKSAIKIGHLCKAQSILYDSRCMMFQKADSVPSVREPCFSTNTGIYYKMFDSVIAF